MVTQDLKENKVLAEQLEQIQPFQVLKVPVGWCAPGSEPFA